jgi:hypothetical protein
MYFSEHNGVFFIEGTISGARRVSPISTELNRFFSQNQLKTLDDLKDKMAQFTKTKGGNAVLSFKYGQRTRFWKSLIGMDDVLWYGSGEIALIDTKALTQL